MSVLNDEDIERYCKEYQLMKHYDKKKIKYASYDLRVGKEYILASEEKPKELGENGVIEIPKYEVCYILTEEELNLPTDVCAFIFSRHRHNSITVKMASNNACCHNSNHNDFDSNY